MISLTEMGELPIMTVDEMEGFINEQVRRVIDGDKRELIILERNSIGVVVVRDKQVFFGGRFRNVEADTLEEAAERVIKDLVVEPGRTSEKEGKTPSGRSVLIIRTTEHDVDPDAVLVREEDFEEGSTRGMSVTLRRKEAGSSRGILGRLLGR